MSESEAGPAGAGPVELLRRRVADDPSRPLVTFYDDRTDERVELSARTFDNWVAKTANFLVDGLGVEPGTRVVLALPPHWQTSVWLMACWSVGLVAEPVSPGSLAARSRDGAAEPFGAGAPYVLATTEEALDDVLADADAEEIVGLSLHALGAPLGHCPPGVVDYAADVRSHGDRFVPGPDASPRAPALSVTNATLTGNDLAAAARSAVEKWELDAQDRLLVDMPFATLDGVLAGLLAPLASGASVIIQRNFDKTAVNRRVSVEHVTAVAGLAGWNDPSGSVRRLA